MSLANPSSVTPTFPDQSSMTEWPSIATPRCQDTFGMIDWPIEGNTEISWQTDDDWLTLRAQHRCFLDELIMIGWFLEHNKSFKVIWIWLTNPSSITPRCQEQTTIIDWPLNGSTEISRWLTMVDWPLDQNKNSTYIYHEWLTLERNTAIL